MTAGAQEGVTNRTVSVGAGIEGYAINLFGPSEFTVAAGSTVTWENPWFEPHTVTFTIGNAAPPPPHDPTAAVPSHPGQTQFDIDGTEYVSSGFIFPGDVFQTTFPETGEYDFFCIIHPGMNGTVTVSDDASEATPQAEMDATANATFGQTLGLLQQEAARLAAIPVAQTANADGTTTWTANTVGGMVGTSDVMQFFPPVMTVTAGDTIVFDSHVPTPHTVTFAYGPPPFPEDMMNPLEEPTFLFPSGPADAFAGEGFVNSGIIGVGFPAGETFEVTFTSPGTFNYICILHVDQGMVGTVNVLAQVTPPETGSGGLLSTDGGASTAGYALAGLLGLTGIALLATRRLRAR